MSESSVARRTGDAQRVLPEKASALAKAVLRNPENEGGRELVGAAIRRAVALAGLSHKEAAAQIGVNDAQFGKWLSGNENPQVHRVFAVVALRQPFVVALAEQCEAEGISVRTVVTLERKLR